MRNRVVEPDWDIDEDLPPQRRTRHGAFGRRPADWIAMVVLAAGAVAIAVNALMLQKGPHPAPFGFARSALVEPTAAVLPLPVARPPTLGVAPNPTNAPDTAAARRPRTPAIADLQRELQRRGFFDDPPSGMMGPKTATAIRDAELALGLPETGEPSDALIGALRRGEFRADPKQVRSLPPAAAGDPRTRTAQHALARLGYGPIRLDGRPGEETRSAIKRFERDRSLPVTGEVGDRLLRELAAVIGAPLE